MSAPCPVCGFDGSSLSPADAAVALRSFPRRYRSVLVRPEEDDQEDPVRRRGQAGWSALDHALWAYKAIESIGRALQQVLVRDQPGIMVPPIEPLAPPAIGPEPGAVLHELGHVTSDVADLAGRTPLADWKRTGTDDSGASFTALDLLRLAVHQGIHHLRAAEHVLVEVTGQPAD